MFHYSGAPEAIYNNLFILSDKLATIFGGPANTTYFYNNIVAAPNGLLTEGTFNGFHINGSSDGTVKNPALSGEMKNNIFTEGILDTVVVGSGVVLESNIEVKTEDLDQVFQDLDGFMDAQPVKALLGRSDFTGEKVETLEYGKGAGVAMSAEAGRSVQVPTGGFDLTQFEGIKLAEKSPAIGAGISTDEMHDYNYKAQNDAVNPLTQDFFEQDITALETVDIGPFQSQGKAAHKHTLALQEGYAPTCTTEGKKDYYICEGCGLLFRDAEGNEQIADKTSVILKAVGHVDEDEDGKCDVCGIDMGTGTPGTDKPGTDKPGTDKPGTDKPGTTDKPSQSTSQNKSGTVKTGDAANLVLWTVIVLAAGAAIIGTVLVRRRNAKGRR